MPRKKESDPNNFDYDEIADAHDVHTIIAYMAAVYPNMTVEHLARNMKLSEKFVERVITHPPIVRYISDVANGFVLNEKGIDECRRALWDRIKAVLQDKDRELSIKELKDLDSMVNRYDQFQERQIERQEQNRPAQACLPVNGTVHMSARLSASKMIDAQILEAESTVGVPN